MGRYKNPYLFSSKRCLWHFLLWKAGVYDDAGERGEPPVDFIYPAGAPFFDYGKPWLLWVGHSSFLTSLGGKHFLTDPVWSAYCSPVPLRRFRRRVELPVALGDLPPLDFVLISHDHYDHLDEGTVRRLVERYPRVEWVVPAGLGGWFIRRGLYRVVELRWWESIILGRFCITAVPAQHFSGRSLWGKDKSHWNGYVVEGFGKRLYFVGDTGYNPYDFRAIGRRWSEMDVSLIPIGAYCPRRFMCPVHVDPGEAVQIHRDVGSLFSIGMHWKTFVLSDESLRSPPYDLYLAMRAQKLPFSSFLPIEPGTYVNW